MKPSDRLKRIVNRILNTATVVRLTESFDNNATEANYIGVYTEEKHELMQGERCHCLADDPPTRIIAWWFADGNDHPDPATLEKLEKEFGKTDPNVIVDTTALGTAPGTDSPA